MAERNAKPLIRFYYTEDRASRQALDYLAKHISKIMKTFSVKQIKISDKGQLEELRAALVKNDLYPPNRHLPVPFAIMNGVVSNAEQFLKQLQNITTARKIVSQPESITIEDWNKAVMASGGEDEPDTMDNASIAKKMDRFNKQRENRLTDKPVSRKTAKSYNNDEDFQSDSGVDNVSTAIYDFNSGDNILEQSRLDEAIDAGKKQSNRPVRKF